MFEKPYIHAQIWKNKRTVHGPAKVKGWKLLESCGVQIITFTYTQQILLVERKYLLTRFTLDQMLNVVRLEVKEESEVSLELLRFIRQQHQEEDPAVKKYQALKRKPQPESQARKNMILYLKNVAGFKMDYFNGMSYDDIRPIFEAKFNLNMAFLLKIKEQIEEDENRAL
nr:hypothetical protein [Tanacetum cinerariifolium]